MPLTLTRLLRNDVVVFVLIVLGYYSFGVFGTFFRIEPGFASAVWPAAGYAAIVALRYGSKAYIPLFVGALLANIYSSGNDIFSISASDLMWNSVRAAGALLQAAISCLLLKKLCDFPLSLNAAKPLLKALVLVSPFACMVSATIGTSSLYLQGIIPFSIVDFVWFTWWVGDSVGVLFFFPLFGMLLPSKLFRPVSNVKVVLVTGSLLLISVCFTFSYSKEVYRKNLNLTFADITEKKVYELQILKRQIETNLFALATLFRNGIDPNIDEFQLIASSLNNGGIPYRAIAWLDCLEREESQAWYEKQSERGLEGSKLRVIDESRQFSQIFPISLTAPYSINSLAIGLDLASHPIAGDTVFEAIKSRAIKATPPVRLQQQSDKLTGNVIYFPVFRNSDDKLLGIAEVVIEVDKSLEKLMLEDLSSDYYHFSISDKQSPSSPYVAGLEQQHNTSHSLHFAKSYQLAWFGRDWLVHFESTDSFENTKKDWLSWLTLIVGFIIAAIGVMFTLIIAGFNEQLKRKVKDKTAQLATVIEQLKKADQVKNEFIANMSHEIRTPLNVVLSTLQLLRKSKQAKKEQELTDSALSSGKTLLTIINDILDVSKLEAGKLEIESTEFDLEKLIQDTVTEQKSIADEKQLEVKLHSTSSVTGVWKGDPTRIKQILFNLISNAIKFTDLGQIDVKVTKYKRGIKVEVTDSGIGMNDTQVTRLFERFEQADTSTTRRFGGTGLGLAIVAQLVHLMKGKIEVTSELNKGSQFKLTIPLIHESREVLKPSDDAQLTMPSLNGTTILLAEDNKVNQTVFKAIMAPAKATLLIAENGKQAIDLFQQENPAIIFMDIQMPEMDGEQACKYIRQLNSTIPIVALTANVLESDVTRYLSEGFNAHLAKPIDINKLIETLVELTVTNE
ncbi:Autoinducer 2 sensor kinase/phosphatase LuxQ [Pseudoalteromonas sp. P1-9]|uniref:ATP-binding protein n=1 Tax=Pseudoalteromonas sp. P1-9 TaxID=1710354 RepID=UPI0006D5DB84|nr:ATP-binding protein [Pseudoalteromonas sp. P1-9]KPV93653.1 Autoinducer 2 sensor kinase/phosphatase LuxQ [Pseudoalteromonas sp. P1-9]